MLNYLGLNNLRNSLLCLLVAVFMTACGGEQEVLRVGSKPFTESMVLAEMIAQLAENEGIAVERSIPFGVTQQVMEATKQDVIDVYPEYNGTALIFLGQAPRTDGEESSAIVQKLFKPLGLEMGGKFGFSNDYAIVMTTERAQELGVTSIGDLAGLSQPVTFAVDDDFVKRPADGLQQMNRRYGISNSTVKTFPVGTEGKDQIVSALLDGSADVAELFATDGQIAEYGLVILEDNLNFFPIYEVAPLVRSEALAGISNFSSVLGKLTGVISAADMQAMNKAVDLDAQTPASVATAFLVAKGLLPEGTEDSTVEKITIAAPPGVERNSETARALRAIRAGFSGNDMELVNAADPLQVLADGGARVAMVGTESFFTVGDNGPVAKDYAQAFAVLGYKTAHLIGRKSGGASSITDMKKIATGGEGTSSAIVLDMLLASLGLSGVEVVNATGDLNQQLQALANGDYDGVFIMATEGDRTLQTALDDNTAVQLLSLDEWAEGGHTAQYSFIRPATIAAQTYSAQFQPIASIHTQFVLASPVATQQSAGEVGPGTTGLASAVPVSADAVKAINDALGAGEIVDPALPIHAALIPTIEVADKSLPFSLDISIVNIFMIFFTVWVLYLIGLPSPRDFTMPKED